MNNRRCGARRLLTATCLLVLSGAPAAQAQMAVIDVASVTQLIQQVQTLAQQLVALQAQLTQMQTLYASVSGNRGMQQLLNSGTPNYLPTDWPQLMSAMQGSGSSYGALSAAIGSAQANNAVLSAAQLATLSANQQATVLAGRQSVALLQGVTQQALSNSSNRFSDLQQLLAAIGTTADQKSVLELQATIAAEQGFLQNEQTKLQVLYQAAQSEQWADSQRQRELIVAGQGRFASRFEPVPLSPL